MITRIWHGRTSVENADKYLNFLLNEGTQGYRETRGNISIKVWRKIEPDHCDFYTVTEWESIEAIKAFAGEAYEKAVYYPADEGVLLEFEEKVHHYEGYDVSPSAII